MRILDCYVAVVFFLVAISCGSDSFLSLPSHTPYCWIFKPYSQDKDSKVSTLARTLFSETKTQPKKQADIFNQVRDLLDRQAARSQGIFEEKFNEIQKFFTTVDFKCRHVNIEPFKFNSPSPDDVVATGKSASRKVAAGKRSSTLSPHKASTSDNSQTQIENIENGSVRKQAESQVSHSIAISNSENLRRQNENSFLKHQEFDFNTTSQEKGTTLKKKTNSSNLAKAYSLEQYELEPWMISEESKSCKKQLHLAVVGHVDAGKSTLAGQLLHHVGHVSDKDMQKFRREAEQAGKGSCTYAWILDASVEERKRGFTMNVAVADFETKNFYIELLDCPGHKGFIPNFISGASQADAAVLVVDASAGAFEKGMSGQAEGQTIEYAQLIRSFGVEQLIVALNKMDIVEVPEERYKSIHSSLGLFLRRCGFKESFLKWIPLSAWKNENVTTAASDFRLKSWYSGPSLLEEIDQLQHPKHDMSKPLRLPISELGKSFRSGQVVATGKLEAGAFKIGTKVLIMPGEILATVKDIEQNKEVSAVAMAGDSIDVVLGGVELSSVAVGSVICHPDYPIPIATCIELKVVILDITIPILVGSQVEFYAHQFRGSATVSRILSILDPKSGKVVKRMPRCLTANQNAIIEVVLSQGICIEVYSNYRSLGRAVLRASGRTVALGIVTAIMDH